MYIAHFRITLLENDCCKSKVIYFSSEDSLEMYDWIKNMVIQHKTCIFKIEEIEKAVVNFD